MNLGDYLQAGLADLTLQREIFPGAGVFRTEARALAGLLAADETGSVFGWAWLHETPHRYWIEGVQSNGDEVVVTVIDTGVRWRLRLGMYDMDDKKRWRKYLKVVDYQGLLAMLQDEVDALALTKQVELAAPALRGYRVLLVNYGSASGWLTVGAMAADENEVVFWSLPEYAQVASYWASVVGMQRAEPGAFMDYWQANGGNGVTWLIGATPEILAPSAELAAELATRWATP